MSRSSTVLLGVLLCGCGDDNPQVDGGVDQSVPSDLTVPLDSIVPPDLTVTGAARFNGDWQLQAVTMVSGARTDAGVPTVEITRTSTPLRLRGDYLFTASDATRGRLLGKLGILEGDHLLSPSPIDADVTIDGDTWLIAPKVGTVVVFPGVLVDEQLTLTWAEGDPRNVDPGDPPRRIVLRRVPAPPTVTVGTWTMLEMDVGGNTIAGDTCIRVNDEGRKANVVIAIDAVHLMTQTSTLTSYSDPACTMISGQPTTDVVEALIDEAAGGFEAWSRPNGESAGDYTKWSFTQPAPRRMLITRVDCAPHPACDGAPTRMLLERP